MQIHFARFISFGFLPPPPTLTAASWVSCAAQSAASMLLFHFPFFVCCQCGSFPFSYVILNQIASLGLTLLVCLCESFFFERKAKTCFSNMYCLYTILYVWAKPSLAASYLDRSWNEFVCFRIHECSYFLPFHSLLVYLYSKAKL